MSRARFYIGGQVMGLILTEYKDIPECCYLKKRRAGDETYYCCDISDHLCEREYNDTECEEYNNYLKEVNNG